MYIFSTEFFRFGEMCTLQGAFWFNNEMVPFCNSWNDHCKNDCCMRVKDILSVPDN